MNASFQVVEGSDSKLQEIVKSALQAVASNIESLVDRKISLDPGCPSLVNDAAIAARLKGKHGHLYGKLEKDLSGTVRLLFGLEDSVTLSSYLRMVPDEVVETNRKKGDWTDEDDEAFGEVGNILFSALDETLRSSTDKKVNVRLSGHSLIDGSADAVSSEFGEDAYLLYPCKCKIAEFPESELQLFVPLDAGEALNTQPIRFGELNGDLEDLDGDDIVDAPIQGQLSAYVYDKELPKVLKRACRRVGFEFDKRPRAEVPNPAAHQGKTVFIEVDRSNAKRLEWCRRLKSSGLGTTVILMLIEPNRLMVASSFKAQADVILGWPCSEGQLAAKLKGLFALVPAGAPEEEAEEAETAEKEADSGAADDSSPDEGGEES